MYCAKCDKDSAELTEELPVCPYCGYNNADAFDELVQDESIDSAFELDDEPRSAQEVARRCVILYGIYRAANGEDRGQISRWLDEQGLWSELSETEQEFLSCDVPNEQEEIDADWQIEDLHLLLWALGEIEAQATLGSYCEVPAIDQACQWFLADTGSFIRTARLRGEDELDELEEQIYEAHWLLTYAQEHQEAVPSELDPDVVVERHQAINWLMGYSGLNWDDVSIET